MTIREYLDPEFFPHTTTPGCSICELIFADGFRQDDLEAKGALADFEEAAPFEELRRKVAVRDDREFDAEMNANAKARGIQVGWGVLTGAMSS